SQTPYLLSDSTPSPLHPPSLHDALPISVAASPSRRNSAAGSTATTSQPRSASANASRPLPAPTSKARPVFLSNWGSQSLWTCSRSEEHTSELQSRENLVCRLLLEKKKRQ